MSYAIESKKRKFERILESLTDSAAPATRTSLNTRNNTVTATTDTTPLDSSKRRRVTPSQIFEKLSSTSSLTTHYLPSSRAAFLDRLETFRNVTKWHISSTSDINAAGWSKRGWICDDTDTVACPSCKERVLVDLSTTEAPTGENEQQSRKGEEDKEAAEAEDPLLMSAAVYEALVLRYGEMIISAHQDTCPWRKRGCDSSIQRIEGLLNVSNALGGVRTRYESLVAFSEEIPRVAHLPSTSTHAINEQELNVVRLEGHEEELDQHAVKLAVCGWQRKEADVVECRHCFRSLGLWLYRGDVPTMEHLDAIDSHLEYCPWREAQAQDTVSTAGLVNVSREGKEEKLPGWLLVYIAVVKDNAKRRGLSSRVPIHQPNDLEKPGEGLTSDQREKKMKELRKRIRDLKNPFNFKSLLRKKE